MADNLFDPIPEPAIYDMTEQMQELLNADYSIPDPAWDYSQTWHHAMCLKQSIERLVDFLQQQEIATPEADHQIERHLLMIQGELIAAQNLLPQRASGLYILDSEEQGNYHIND